MFENVIPGTVIMVTLPNMTGRFRNDFDVPGMTLLMLNKYKISILWELQFHFYLQQTWKQMKIGRPKKNLKKHLKRIVWLGPWALGPMDGVGGVLKRTADSHVLMGQDIKTASEFVDLFKESKIHVQEVSVDEVKSMKKMIPKSIDAVPGIMKITNIVWEKGPEVIIELFQYESLSTRTT